jgi:selenocysteine lyase/cysteine desulfurase
VVGGDATFDTPFGRRLMVYCDYTASGRCLGFVERYLQQQMRIYANTHTEDDVSGRSMTRLLHRAEQRIKDSLNAGPEGRLVAVGTGSTAAIDKLQQILGVALPPATPGPHHRPAWPRRAGGGCGNRPPWCSWAPTSTTATRSPGARAWRRW